MARLCQYKDLLGIPEEGAHSPRIFGFALVDTILTVIAAVLIGYAFGVSIIKVTVILVLVAIILHWLFCVDTKLNHLLGLSN